MLGEEGFVHARRRAVALDDESYPADAVSLRSISSDNFVIVDITHGTQRHRRDRLHQRPVDAAREGDLHHRGPAVPGRAARFRRTQGLRAIGGLRLLHRRDHLHEGDDSRDLRATFVDDGWRLRRTLVGTPRRRCPSSSPASSASRRSGSTPTRTSGRASSICPSSRCTRRCTG